MLINWNCICGKYFVKCELLLTMVVLAVKNRPVNAGDVRGVGSIPRLGWNSHGQKSLAGYSPEGRKEREMTEATEHAHVIKLWCEWLLSFILAHSKFSWAGVSFLIKNNVYLGEYYLLCGWGTGKVWGRVLFTHVIWGKNPCVILLERWNHHWFFLSFTYWYYWYHLSTPGMECQIKEPLSLYIS